MIGHIVKKEFLANLKTFRFTIGLLVCITLLPLISLVLLHDYERALLSYNQLEQQSQERLKQVKVYSQLTFEIHRPPEPLSVMSIGLDRRFEPTVRVSHHAVPRLEAGYRDANPLLRSLPPLDLTRAFMAILSLLGLLLAYDAISGEREQGTLRLMMMNSLPRGQVLIGKYLGGLFCLAIPILIGFLIVVIVMLSSPMIQLGWDEAVRLGLILLCSLLFVSCFLTLGLLLSTRTRASHTALISGLFIWILTVFLVPNVGAYLATQLVPINPASQVDAAEQDIWKELETRVDMYAMQHEPSPYRFSGFDGYTKGQTWADNASYRVMDFLRNVSAYAEPSRIEAAEKVWRVRERYERQMRRQVQFAQNLARLSPAGTYAQAVSILARTDTDTYLRFIQEVRAYRQHLVNDLMGKGIFASLSFFTVPRADEPLDWARLRTRDDFYYPERTTLADFPPLDLRGLPHFQYQPEGIGASLQRMTIDVLLLIGMNALFLLGTHASFLRSDL